MLYASSLYPVFGGTFMAFETIPETLPQESIRFVCQFMASFLLDQSGSNLLDKIKKKRARDQFVKREHKFFTYQFADTQNKKDVKLLLDFLDGKVVWGNLYYSKDGDISVEQKEQLWIDFKKYWYNQTGDTYASPKYIDKLIFCANFHNQLVNELILNERDHFIMKGVQNDQKHLEKSMRDIISTLNTNTTLSNQNSNLDFFINQLENIIFSLRRALKNKQKIFILSLFIILGNDILLILSASHWLQSTPSTQYSAESLLSLIISSISIIPAFLSTCILIRNMWTLEKQIQKHTEELWILHFRIYSQFLEKQTL